MLTLEQHSISRATAYRFVFREGWAIFTLNDATGEFTVHSDWGTYGHRWNLAGLGGRTLTEFIAGFSDGAPSRCAYLVNKLQLDTQSKNLEDIVDVEETLRTIRGDIVHARRNGELLCDEARWLWDQAGEWVSEDMDIYRDCPEELSEFLGRTPWESVRHTKPGRYVVLCDELLPFFAQWLRDNVVKNASKYVATTDIPLHLE